MVYKPTYNWGALSCRCLWFGVPCWGPNLERNMWADLGDALSQQILGWAFLSIFWSQKMTEIASDFQRFPENCSGFSRDFIWFLREKRKGKGLEARDFMVDFTSGEKPWKMSGDDPEKSRWFHWSLDPWEIGTLVPYVWPYELGVYPRKFRPEQ